jgi:hypothetical protein
MFDEADEITVELLLKPVALGLIAAFVMSLVLSIGKSEAQFQTRLAANFRSVVYLSVPIVILGYAFGILDRNKSRRSGRKLNSGDADARRRP